MNTQQRQVVVVGAGLVGSLLALRLQQERHQVTLVEKRPDLRRQDISEGRSINLALSQRGWRTLQQAGLADQLGSVALPMAGRRIHNADGSQKFQPYGREDQAIYSVLRDKLTAVILDAAEAAGVELHFDTQCLEAYPRTNQLLVKTPTEKIRFEAELIMGADGAFSPVRTALQRMPRFNFSQDYIGHGYKELTLPPDAKGHFQLPPDGLHIWPRGEFMLIALPNPDRSFTCTLFLAYEGTPSFEQLQTPQQVRAFFDEHFADISPLLPGLEEEFDRNPTSSMVMISCAPWTYASTGLIGDAAHAILPFYGQGMNAGFEDIYHLLRLAQEHHYDWPTTLKAYEAFRLPSGNAIRDLALSNFREMRDRVGDPRFLIRKKIEARLQEHFPDRWLPLYSMVTFSYMPYEQAKAIGELQDHIMEDVMRRPEIEKYWESLNLESLVRRLEKQMAREGLQLGVAG